MASVWKGFTIIIWLNSALVCLGQTGDALTCDFEENFCGWITRDSDKPWRRSKLKSPTKDTGPETGHTTANSNYYISLHAADFKDDSNIVQPGKCVLASSRFNTSKNGGCLIWFVHMVGPGLGNLTVNIFDQDRVPHKKIYSNPTNGWQCGYQSLSGNRLTQIKFTAYTGANVRGDIALDDIRFEDKTCAPDVCSSLTSPATPSTITNATDVVSVTQSTGNNGTTLGEAISTTPGDEAPGYTAIIVGVAVAAILIIIIAAIIGFIMYRRSKKNYKPPINFDVMADQTQYADTEEVYALPDESQILPRPAAADDAGYEHPVDKSAELPPHASAADDNYLTMSMRSDYEDNYVETVPGPNEIGKTSDESQVAGNPSQGEANPGFLGDDLRLYENVERESFYENQEMAPPPCSKKPR